MVREQRCCRYQLECANWKHGRCPFIHGQYDPLQKLQFDLALQEYELALRQRAAQPEGDSHQSGRTGDNPKCWGVSACRLQLTTDSGCPYADCTYRHFLDPGAVKDSLRSEQLAALQASAPHRAHRSTYNHNHAATLAARRTGSSKRPAEHASAESVWTRNAVANAVANAVVNAGANAGVSAASGGLTQEDALLHLRL